MNRFLRTGYWALLLGGAVLAAGAALSLTVAGTLSQQALSGRFELGAVLRMLGTTAIIVGVGALAARQADRAGRFGIVAYLLTVASLVLHAGWMFSDAFISGAMAAHAPGVLDGTIDDSRIGLAAMAGWIANAMVLLLAVVLVTEWEEFARLDLGRVKSLMRRGLFIDGRNVFDADAIAQSGLQWEGVGR